jgi:hypothetical protein
MNTVETHPLNMVCGNTYYFSKNGQEYFSKLESNDDGIITFANEQVFDENTTTIFYECRVDVVEELLKKYELALGSEKCQRLILTEDFKNAVEGIINTPDALSKMRDCDKTFNDIYEMHYLKREKMFQHPDWKIFSSMCQSLLMSKYH